MLEKVGAGEELCRQLTEVVAVKSVELTEQFGEDLPPGLALLPPAASSERPR